MMGPDFWTKLAKTIGVSLDKMASTVYCSEINCNRVAHDKHEGKYYCSKHLPEKKEAFVVPDRIVLSEAAAAGFFRIAKPMGWGLYRAEDLDGGLGSIWSVEKGADGSQFLVKQVDPEGEVMRKSAALEEKAAGSGNIVQRLEKIRREFDVFDESALNMLAELRYELEETDPKLAQRVEKIHRMFESEDDYSEQFTDEQGLDALSALIADLSVGRSASVQRIAVAPPGEEKLVKKLKKEPGVENPWAVAWSVHNKKKASQEVCECGDLKSQHKIVNDEETGREGVTWKSPCKECLCRGYHEIKRHMEDARGRHPIPEGGDWGKKSSTKTAGRGEEIYDEVLNWMKAELTKAIGPGEHRMSDEELGMAAMGKFQIDVHEAAGILVLAHSETGA